MICPTCDTECMMICPVCFESVTSTWHFSKEAKEYAKVAKRHIESDKKKKLKQKNNGRKK